MTNRILGWTELDNLSVSYSRYLALEILKKSGTGHTGATLSLTPLFYLMYSRILRHRPTEPNWSSRDRLIVSCGHASLAQYVQLHLSGYDLSDQDLQKFRSIGSKTPGHPEYGLTPGVETSSGPLGQGFATGVGIALSKKISLEKNLQSAVPEPTIYVIMSDGDLQEGITSEAASLAAYYDLDNFVVVYDSNKITIDGAPAVSPRASTGAIFMGLGWNVLVVPLHESGEIDHEKLFHALVSEREINKPTLVILESIIGWPAPNSKGSAKIHGSVLTSDEHELTQSILGINGTSAPALAKKVVNHYKMCVNSNYRSDSYGSSGALKRNSSVLLETLSNISFPREISARKANGIVISKLQSVDRRIVGGSADLTESNALPLDNQFVTNPKNHLERIGSNLRFGVREHAMAAVTNGLALDEALIPFCATYLVFSDYQKPAIRMAALMNIPSIFIWTHDSIAVGADGPTHQPIEHLVMLRAIPNFPVVRPASGEEVRQTWKEILKKNGPIGISLSRQDLPNPSDKEITSEHTRFGAYVYHENFEDGLPEMIVIATGSELQYAYQAAKSDLVRNIRVRVVSMPCQEWFRKQPSEYKESVLPNAIRNRISVEAGSTFGWSEFVGQGVKIGIDEFGLSGSGEDLLQHFGFTTERVIKEILNYRN